MVKKRSMTVSGHATSLSLEDEFWNALNDIAAEKKQSLNHLVSEIDTGRGEKNLSSALRVFVLQHYKKQLTQASLSERL
jgi:predicted DNA-binding ribbon-helix-helix protein